MQKPPVFIVAIAVTFLAVFALSSCCSPCKARSEARKAAKVAEQAAAEAGQRPPVAGEIGGPPAE